MHLSHVRRIFLISTCSILLLLSCYILPARAETTMNFQQYFVASGDTLWLLAQRYTTTVDKLSILNPQAKLGLSQGQALLLPVLLENGSIRYTVQKGDTLFLISSRCNRSMTEIRQASSLYSDALVPGQQIYIPAARTGMNYYIVKVGDSLWSIAKNHSVSLSELMTMNNLSNSNIVTGQILEIPAKDSIPNTNTNTNTNSNTDTDTTTDTNTNHNTNPQNIGVGLYRVKSGDYLDKIAANYGTTSNAIYQTNQLHSDILMPGQPLFIPKGREAVQVEGPIGLKKTDKGEFLPWNWARWVYNIGANATVIDTQTGKMFQVKYMGGSNHADSEPLTPKDTEIMRSLYPNGWSWSTRPVLLQVGGRTLAASIAGMPHSVDTIANNNFAGHFDLYFYNSISHNTSEIQPSHQKNVLQAAGLTTYEADAFVTKLDNSFSGYNF